MNEDPVRSPEYEAFIAEARKIGASVGDMDRYAEGHKYWYFRPAWEIESAVWAEHFKEDDPALIVSIYLREFFETTDQPPRKLLLEEADVHFLTWLVDLVTPATATSCGGRDVVPRLRAILVTVFGLEEVIEGAVSWTDADFLSLCRQSTPLLRRSLIGYWARRVDFASRLDEFGEAAVTQAAYMSRCLIGYLVGKYENSKHRKSEIVQFLSSHEVLHLADRIFSLEIETSANVLGETSINIQKAIYDAREKTFTGTFPFSMKEAKDFIGRLDNDSAYWLAKISYYDAQEYEIARDDFSIVRLLSDENFYSEPRVNRSAIARFRAFRDAFDSIKSDGFNELAEAWWAFFLASQALALPGLGLTGSDIAEVAAITLSLPRSKVITKAAAFVLKVEETRKQTLSVRRSKAVFEPVAASVSNSTGATVNVLAISNVQAEHFLRREFGEGIWEGLGELSKKDLIEGENF